MITIIDYGMGNLRSVYNAFISVNADVCVCENPRALKDAKKIVLPGVGAFGSAMQNLIEGGWIEVLESEVREKGKRFLGICLGQQLLATTGTEYGFREGLNWIEGTTEKLLADNLGLRIPHIGWNDVSFLNPAEGLSKGIDPVETFYFVHSYVLKPADPNVVKGICNYGVAFAACIEKDNLWATQFHPEKSHSCGIQILKNFVNLRS